MKRWPSILLASALTGALVVVFCPRVPGPDELIPPSESEALAAGFPETPALRVLAKRLIAREAAAGRRSLLEAAALFRELNRLPPEAVLVPPLDEAFPRSRLPGRTSEELLCRQVVVYASVALDDGPPDQAEAAVVRLEAEFWEELEKHGAIRLPDLSPLPSIQELLEQARAAMPQVERQALIRPSQAARKR